MSDERPPTCFSRPDTNEHPDFGEHEDHKGWVHAQTLEQVHQGLLDSETNALYDVDGDVVLAVQVLQSGSRQVHFQMRNGQKSHYTIESSDELGYILVPAHAPVTDDEVAAALASIKEAMK